MKIQNKHTTIPCIFPFTTLQINPRGEIFLCCPAWTKQGYVGRLNDKTTIDDIWNNTNSQFIRKSLLNNNQFPICNPKFCPFMIEGKSVNLTTKDEQYKGLFKEISNGNVILETAPRSLIIAHSGRCNLRCIMCGSNERYVKEDVHLNSLIYQREIPRMLPRLSEIIMTGDGDPFFMKDSREFMQKFDSKRYPDIKFSIITNGLLLNSSIWKSISHNRFGWISVSIDAATKETYEHIRRGGRWEMLQENLKLLRDLRKQKRFESFTISFVVMKYNYTEMKKFVEMGLRLGCDRIHFQKVFGVVAAEENISFTQNKKVYKEIALILNDPIFKRPEVDMNLIKEYEQYIKHNVTIIDQAKTKILEKILKLAKKLKEIKTAIKKTIQ
jgi:sulfatase maturation enzyme AslB (radical SAM superfamily)